MPILDNQRHERFAQELAKGAPVNQAAKAALFEPKQANEAAGFYVYCLIDPADGGVFYVGKGKGRRCLCHERDARAGRISNPAKHARIRVIHAQGREVQVIILEDGLSERDALRLERQIIGAIGFGTLTNAMPGATLEPDRVVAAAAEGEASILTTLVAAALGRITLTVVQIRAGLQIVRELRAIRAAF